MCLSQLTLLFVMTLNIWIILSNILLAVDWFSQNPYNFFFSSLPVLIYKALPGSYVEHQPISLSYIYIFQRKWDVWIHSCIKSILLLINLQLAYYDPTVGNYGIHIYTVIKNDGLTAIGLFHFKLANLFFQSMITQVFFLFTCNKEQC